MVGVNHHSEGTDHGSAVQQRLMKSKRKKGFGRDGKNLSRQLQTRSSNSSHSPKTRFEAAQLSNTSLVGNHIFSERSRGNIQTPPPHNRNPVGERKRTAVCGGLHTADICILQTLQVGGSSLSDPKSRVPNKTSPRAQTFGSQSIQSFSFQVLRAPSVAPLIRSSEQVICLMRA